jgi:hypothetical protein
MPPKPHVVKASSLAYSLANPIPEEPSNQLTKNVSFNCPLGLLETIDFMAERSAQTRTQVLIVLLESGFGLVMEQMSPEARSAFHADLFEHMGSPGSFEGVQKHFDLVAVGKEL